MSLDRMQRAVNHANATRERVQRLKERLYEARVKAADAYREMFDVLDDGYAIALPMTDEERYELR